MTIILAVFTRGDGLVMMMIGAYWRRVTFYAELVDEVVFRVQLFLLLLLLLQLLLFFSCSSSPFHTAQYSIA